MRMSFFFYLLFSIFNGFYLAHCLLTSKTPHSTLPTTAKKQHFSFMLPSYHSHISEYLIQLEIKIHRFRSANIVAFFLFYAFEFVLSHYADYSTSIFFCNGLRWKMFALLRSIIDTQFICFGSAIKDLCITYISSQPHATFDGLIFLHGKILGIGTQSIVSYQFATIFTQTVHEIPC